MTTVVTTDGTADLADGPHAITARETVLGTESPDSAALTVTIDTTAPLSPEPLQRLVMAQDTGSAIVGPVRVDYFWGWGDEALDQAGRMRQPLRVWALWPQADE